MQRINITLPDELARDLRRSVPEGKRSEFIAKTIQEKLEKKKKNKLYEKELLRRLKANKEFYKKVAEEWKYVDAEELKRIP